MVHASRKIAFAAFLLLPLLCNCTPPTPETELTWDANDRPQAVRAASNQPRVYEYHDPSDVTPMPRPSPVYAAATRCSCNQPVQSAELAPVSSGAVSFAWPVSGPVIATFGSDVSGARNDGINIATSLGEPIHASAGGSVIYAGDELKGYGNLVLIKHSDGYVTAYAHAERMLVSRGDTVTKGQVIGYAGKTGDVTSPQLHFEIRHGTQPVNPSPLLVASR